MKFSPKKIERYANSIYSVLESKEDLVIGEKEKILFNIRQIIDNNFKEEEEIEEEAKRILEENKRSIEMRNLSYSELLKNAKKIIAKERKFILKFSDDRIEFISKKIMEKLTREELIKRRINRRQITAWIESGIYRETRLEDEINKEAKDMLSKMTKCPPVGSFEYNSLFIKKREEISKRKNYEV